MPVFNATSSVTSPRLVPPVKGGNQFREQVNVSERGTGKVLTKFLACRGSTNRQIKLCTSGPIGLGCKLQSNRRRMQSTAFIASASASGLQGQTQTIERQTTTITNAPASPKLDDGGSGLPPRDEGGGGGGGGGGGDFSGGFYLFGFLAFLGLLKDLESEQNCRRGRRRR